MSCFVAGDLNGQVIEAVHGRNVSGTCRLRAAAVVAYILHGPAGLAAFVCSFCAIHVKSNLHMDCFPTPTWREMQPGNNGDVIRASDVGAGERFLAQSDLCCCRQTLFPFAQLYLL